MAFFPSPFFWIAYFSFYLSLYPSSNVHVWVRLSRTDTCPISPYPKWLEVVVKAEEYGPIRCRVLYCSTGSFFTWVAPALCSPFLLGALRDAEHKIVLGHILRPFWTPIVRPRHYFSSAQALGFNKKWAGIINSLTPQ